MRRKNPEDLPYIQQKIVCLIICVLVHMNGYNELQPKIHKMYFTWKLRAYFALRLLYAGLPLCVLLYIPLHYQNS